MVDRDAWNHVCSKRGWGLGDDSCAGSCAGFVCMTRRTVIHLSIYHARLHPSYLDIGGGVRGNVGATFVFGGAQLEQGVVPVAVGEWFNHQCSRVYGAGSYSLNPHLAPSNRHLSP